MSPDGDHVMPKFSFLSDKQVYFLLFKRLPSEDVPFDVNSMVQSALGKSVVGYLQKQKFKFCVDVSSLPSGELVYAIAVNHSNDFKMIKAAKDLGIPRGFKIVCTTTSILGVMGFYPKFENDSARTVQVSVPQTTEKLQFFKKFSGFLGMLGCFRLDGCVFAIAGSKKSCSNSFSVDCSRLCAEWLTLEAACEIADSKLTLCFEVMSRYDQSHGARVINEATILTCLSKFNGIHDKISVGTTRIVEYMSLEDVREFGMRIGAPVANLFISEDVESINKFAELLHQAKNYATNEEFNTLCQEAGINILQGNTNHELVLGNVLEGIVAKFILADGSVHTLKLKLVSYIIRTMALRSALHPGPKHPLALDSSSKALRSFFDRIISNWTTDKDATGYWVEVCMRSYDLAQDKPTYPPNTTSEGYFTDVVAPHISAVDEIVGDFTPADFEPEEKFKDLGAINHCLIIVTGPIGAGKTTFGDWVSEKLGSVHIDGDILPGYETTTLDLKNERMGVTYASIYQALLKSKVVVFSTGGGILLPNRGMSDIQTYLYRLGIRGLRIVHMGVSSETSNIDYMTDDTISAWLKSYHNAENVKSVVQRRVSTGQWTIPTRYQGEIDKFIEFIQSRSENNGRLQRRMQNSMELDGSFVVPASVNGVVPDTLSFDDVMSMLSPFLPEDKDTNIVSSPMCVNQFRVIAEVEGHEGYFHMTVNYNPDGFELSSEFISEMEKLVGTTVHGKIFSNGKGRIVMLDDIQLPRDIDFGCHTAHITVTVPSGGAVQSLYKTAMLRRFGKVPSDSKVQLSPETFDTYDGSMYAPKMKNILVKFTSLAFYA